MYTLLVKGYRQLNDGTFELSDNENTLAGIPNLGLAERLAEGAYQRGNYACVMDSEGNVISEWEF